MRNLSLFCSIAALSLIGLASFAEGANIKANVSSLPIEFVLFGLTLLGIALFHRHTVPVALAGLTTITSYKLAFTGFQSGPGIGGLVMHLQHEVVILANLFLLLTGLALLTRHFEASRVPDALPALLPDDWTGGLMLLAVVFVLSAFLDNIAAALVGGTIARHVFRDRVHVGYLASIVAASNAGGSGSVIGDTTTTMMWINGISPLKVLNAYIASGVAFFIFAIPSAYHQQRYSAIIKHAPKSLRIEWTRLAIVAAILVVAVLANVTITFKFPALLEVIPVIGLSIWAVLILAAPFRKPDWEILPETAKSAVFLLALVVCASMMPVEKLPPPSWQSTLGLGFISAVFDNIPLTALALTHGGYDWGFVAYAVGFGGSMIWFGSSAGVALTVLYPEAKSVWLWLRQGWYVALAYVIGFLIMLAVLGWHPDTPAAKDF
jgi:Na+/H+ antiporter NhaD/arsenite permease-like protein